MSEILFANDLADGLMEKLPKDIPSKAAARRIVDAIFDQISDAVSNGNSVRISGFGTFESVEHAARTAVNPNDPSQKIDVPAKRKPKFRAAGAFRDAVADK